jgi:hypothetical protein
MADAASQLMMLQPTAALLQDHSSSSGGVAGQARLLIGCSISTADTLLNLHISHGPYTWPVQQLLVHTHAFMLLLQMLLDAAVEVQQQQQYTGAPTIASSSSSTGAAACKKSDSPEHSVHDHDV